MAGLDLLPHLHDAAWFWVVRSLMPRYFVSVVLVVVDDDHAAVDVLTVPAFFAKIGMFEFARRPSPCRCRRSAPRADEQRHRLALHVRTHQRAVGVVVLEERDQRGRDTDDLLRRDVDVVDLFGVDLVVVAVLAGQNALRPRACLGVDSHVGRSHDLGVSSSARRKSTSSVTLPFSTLR
jgi:hypothetical protein